MLFTYNFCSIYITFQILLMGSTIEKVGGTVFVIQSIYNSICSQFFFNLILLNGAAANQVDMDYKMEAMEVKIDTANLSIHANKKSVFIEKFESKNPFIDSDPDVKNERVHLIA